MKKSIGAHIALSVWMGTLTASAAFTATFDSKDTGPSGYYRPDTVGTYDWTDGGMTFNLSIVDDGWGGDSWAGFTYSDVNNTNTPGWGNQFAAYKPGTDVSGTGVYAVGYIDEYNEVYPTISFSSAMTVQGLYVNNTTYAALDMHNGSGFSKAFTTDDWFKLTITGFDGNNDSLGTIDYDLADFAGYTDGDNKDDYMTSAWTWIDLTSLGDDVHSLEFTLTSSDTGEWGMNTPSYFAIDNVQAIPEPASVVLVLLGALGVFGMRRISRYTRLG